MSVLPPFLRSLALTGTGAAAAVCLALPLLAFAWGRGLLQPLNASAHWLYGREAAAEPGFDAAITAAGLGTNIAAAFFWGAVMALALGTGLWRGWAARCRFCALAGTGAIVAFAALVLDYGILPETLRPGWELVLPPAGVGLGFVALAAGLALGGHWAAPSPARIGFDPGARR